MGIENLSQIDDLIATRKETQPWVNRPQGSILNDYCVFSMSYVSDSKSNNT